MSNQSKWWFPGTIAPTPAGARGRGGAAFSNNKQWLSPNQSDPLPDFSVNLVGGSATTDVFAAAAGLSVNCTGIRFCEITD